MRKSSLSLLLVPPEQQFPRALTFLSDEHWHPVCAPLDAEPCGGREAVGEPFEVVRGLAGDTDVAPAAGARIEVGAEARV